MIENAYPIEIISDPNDFAKDEAWWTIYQHAFPVPELEPKEVLLKGLERGVTLSLRVRDVVTQKTIGIAHGQFLQSFRVFMLIYIAIAKDYRGRGVGRYFFKDIERKIDVITQRSVGYPSQSSSTGSHHGLVFEVDRPDGVLLASEVMLAQQRIKFYQSLGYFLQDIDYFQPALIPGQDPVPMHLMMRHAVLNPRQQASLVQSIYFEKYSADGGVSRVAPNHIASLWQKISQINHWF